MLLEPGAAARMARLESAALHSPGLGFAVCVDGDVVYAGALWTSLSSAVYPGIVIDIYPASRGEALPVLLGYPPGYFQGLDDQRYEETLHAVLEQEGLLWFQP